MLIAIYKEMIGNIVIPVIKDDILYPVFSSTWKLMMVWEPACSLY
jgi:hypothetical protein